MSVESARSTKSHESSRNVCLLVQLCVISWIVLCPNARVALGLKLTHHNFSGCLLRLALSSKIGRPMINPEIELPPINQQELNVRSTPREEMDLYPLDTFAYEFPGREVRINFEITEFTAICPFSDFPDFATIRLEYVPNDRCVELKSLKLYINSFRNVKIFHEHVINVILDDFVRACDPLSVEIEGDFHVRGNIKTVVRASFKKK